MTSTSVKKQMQVEPSPHNGHVAGHPAGEDIGSITDEHASPNGHQAADTLNVEALQAKEGESAPWAGDETIDYTKLKAPDFLQTPVTKKPTAVKAACRNLHNQEFVRRFECEQSAIPFRVIKDKNNRGVTYIVPEELKDILERYYVLANLELVINQDDELIFVVVPFSDTKGNTCDYWTTLKAILAESTDQWVKVLADRGGNKYLPDYPQIPIPDPQWPELDWGKLFADAFKGRVLHPQHRAMRGFVGGKR